MAVVLMVVGALAVATFAFVTAGATRVELPAPQIALVFGGLMMAASALALFGVWPLHRQRRLLGWLVVVGALLALAMNGEQGLVTLPLLILALHLVLEPAAALMASLALMTAGVITALLAAPATPALPAWRLLGTVLGTVMLAQWVTRRQRGLDRLAERVTARLDALSQVLARENLSLRESQAKAEQARQEEAKARHEAAAMQSLLLDAMESMAHGMAVIDARHRVVAFNHRFLELLDLPSDLLERRPTMHEIVAFQLCRGDMGPDAADLPPFIADLAQLDRERSSIQDNGAALYQTDPYVRRDGQGRYLEFSTRISAAGYCVRTVTDITPHKRMAESLAETVAERERELARGAQARAALEQALARSQTMERSLSRSEALLQAVVQTLPHALLLADDQGVIQLFNAQACDVLNIPAAWLETRPSVEQVRDWHVARGARPMFMPPGAEVVGTLPAPGEPWPDGEREAYTRLSPDGRHWHVRTWYLPSRHLVRTFTDVTEPMRAADALRQALDDRDAELIRTRAARDEQALAVRQRDQAMASLQAAMQMLSHGLLVMDALGWVEHWNPVLLQMLHLPDDYFGQRRCGHDVLWLHLQRGDYGEDTDIIRRYIDQSLPSDWTPDCGRPPWPMLPMPGPDWAPSRTLKRVRLSADRQRIVRTTLDGRTLEHHQVALPSGGHILVITDISAHARVSDELRRSVSQLRLAEGQLKVELERSRRAMNLQADFVAAVSHELRTPLNGIAGMAELLGDTVMTDEQSAHLGDLRTGIAQLTRLTDDLLDLSRISSRGFALEAVRFDLYQPLRASVESARVAARGRPVSVEMALEGESLPVRGDPLRLGQVVNNLLVNALKFTDSGTVRLTARWRVDPGRAQRVALQLEVSDSGCGIDPSMHELIFEPFHQGAASTNRLYGGTGLGLSVCRQLVTAMEGSIDVVSQRGQGATFRVSVMLEAAPLEVAAPSAPAQEPAAVRLDGLRVLVADDNPVNQKLMHAWLSQAGAQVEQAFDGVQALQRAGQQAFDVILMDVAMPGMTGLEATRAIRAFKSRLDTADVTGPTVPIVGVTAMARLEDQSQCLDAGMDAHLGKPVHRAELLATLRRVLAQRAASA